MHYFELLFNIWEGKKFRDVWVGFVYERWVHLRFLFTMLCVLKCEKIESWLSLKEIFYFFSIKSYFPASHRLLHEMRKIRIFSAFKCRIAAIWFLCMSLHRKILHKNQPGMKIPLDNKLRQLKRYFSIKWFNYFMKV